MGIVWSSVLAAGAAAEPLGDGVGGRAGGQYLRYFGAEAPATLDLTLPAGARFGVCRWTHSLLAARISRQARNRLATGSSSPTTPSSGTRPCSAGWTSERFLAVVPEVVANEQPLTVVLNWTAEIARRRRRAGASKPGISTAG
jgi:hypothetical protein